MEGGGEDVSENKASSDDQSPECSLTNKSSSAVNSSESSPCGTKRDREVGLLILYVVAFYMVNPCHPV